MRPKRRVHVHVELEFYRPWLEGWLNGVRWAGTTARFLSKLRQELQKSLPRGEAPVKLHVVCSYWECGSNGHNLRVFWSDPTATPKPINLRDYSREAAKINLQCMRRVVEVGHW